MYNILFLYLHNTLRLKATRSLLGKCITRRLKDILIRDSLFITIILFFVGTAVNTKVRLQMRVNRMCWQFRKSVFGKKFTQRPSLQSFSKNRMCWQLRKSVFGKSLHKDRELQSFSKIKCVKFCADLWTNCI